MKKTTIIVVIACVIALCFALAGCGGQASTSSSAASSSTSASSAASASSSASSSAAASSSASSAASASTSTSASQASTSSSSAVATDTNQAAIDQAVAQGYQVFEGTLRVLPTDELVKLQGYSTEMFPAKGEHAVLIFDQETNVDGMSADGSGMRTDASTMLGVAEHTEYSSFVIDFGNIDSWRSLDGQHITVAAKAEQITFPSDVRLPVGEPWTGDAIAL